MRRSIGLSMSFVVMLTMLMTTPVAANHQASCSDLYTNRWSGIGISGQKHGAVATLEGQTLDQCLNPGFIEVSGSWAWVNVVGPADYDIVQIGVGKCREPGLNDCDSTMRVYWAYGRRKSSPGCSAYSDRGPTPTKIQQSDGLSHSYKVWHATNYWRVYLAGVQKASVAEAEICWTPSGAQWFGESWDAGDAIGGTSANKFRFSSAQYANSEGGAFTNTSFSSCNINSGSIYKCSVVSGTSFDIWTSR